MRNTALIFLLLIATFLCSFSQNIKFEHYNENDGLSHTSVRKIIKDKYGFLWIGTFSGLNRFDGYEFKSYLSSALGENKLLNDDITDLVFDETKNHLWIGTRKGLTLLKVDTQEFITFLPDKNNKDSLPEEEIRSIYIDKFQRVWVGTKNFGVYLLHLEENRFESVKIEGFTYIKSIVEDKKGNIWVGSYGTGGVAKITLDSHGNIAQLVKYELTIPNSKEKNPYLYLIYENEKSDIFVGTRKGLYKLNKTNNSFENLYITDSKTRGHLGPYFLTITQAPDGKYWVGTMGGLLVCEQLEDIAKGKFEWYYTVLSDNTSLAGNLVSSLYFDPAGVLWIATENGLDKYDSYENQFNLNKDISLYIGNKAPSIRGFAKTVDNKIIVATRYNGLFVSENDRFKPLFNNQKDIASVFSVDGKTFLCGLWDGKVVAYNYSNNTAKILNYGFEESPVFAFNKIDEENLIIGSFGEGAIVVNPKTLKKKEEFGVLLPSYQINKITKDKNDNIWFATETGVIKYSKLTNESILYNQEDGLLHDNISDVLFDEKNKIWVATRKGICLYDSLLKKFEPLKSPVELANKWVTDIVKDSKDNLWFNINNNNVVRLNSDRLKLNVYQVNSGNRLDFFSSGGFYNSNSSNIYLGGKTGVISFSPYTIKENKMAPMPLITEFKVQNKEVFPLMEINGQVPFTKNINEGKNVELSYENRNFSLKFSSPSYTIQKLNKFEYKLEGFDENWITANYNNRSIQYTNLFPGSYVFKVKAANSDGVFSEVAAYDIKIRYPFWLSLKALLLYLVLLFLIIYFSRKEIKNRAKLKQDLITEKVNHERDVKLNNEKLRFFTNISHELRTPLTLILGPVKQLLDGNEIEASDYQKSRYNLIYQNANRLFKLVNQVLDFRKAQTGELELKVSPTDIIVLTKGIIDSFKEFAFNKKINLSFNSENDSLFGWVDKDKYDKILYNLLSNALKFTDKHGSVDLFLGLKEDNLVVEVTDTGIGIPLISQKKIFTRFYQVSNKEQYNTGSGIGLSLVKSLVELHKGTISVKSSPKNGSVFSVEIPINKNRYSEDQIGLEKSKAKHVETKTIKKVIQNIEVKEKLLVVEDNVELRKYLVDYLSDYYKVYAAENGKEGLLLCKQVKPILCVVDVMMPVMGGLEFCGQLKKDELISHIPIILLTALSDNEDKVKGYNVGADGYLEKPFDSYLLKSIIENTIKTRKELKLKFSGDSDSEIGLVTHSPIDEAFIKKLTQLIEENISDITLSTSFICHELNMSSSKLYRKIKELTDLAPNEYIRTIRLKKSATLLKTKKYNVSEVATLVGFSDPLYLSRCFKKQFGFPPSKLLKEK